MDLSFPRPDPTDPAAGEVALPPADAAALRDVLAEQAGGQARGEAGAAPTGAFNAAMAARLRAWRRA